MLLIRFVSFGKTNILPAILYKLGKGDVDFSSNVSSALRNLTMLLMVSSDRRRSNNSCSSKNSPSTFTRFSAGRTSKKNWAGKSSSPCRIASISQVRSSCWLISTNRVPNAMLSTRSSPSVLRHLPFSSWRIWLKPIFCSKFCG